MFSPEYLNENNFERTIWLYPLVKTQAGSTLFDSFLQHYSIFGLNLRPQDMQDDKGQETQALKINN